VPDVAPPWFADRAGDFLLFRVNRRPIGENTLFPARMPEDVFEHFVGVLAPGWEVESGRRNRRRWRVGGIDIDREHRVLTGKLGWTPEGEEVVAEWSEEEMGLDRARHEATRECAAVWLRWHHTSPDGSP